MDWIKDAIIKAKDIKDWRIALIYCAMVSFIAYCTFFGGVKQITDLIGSKTSNEQIVDTLKVK